MTQPAFFRHLHHQPIGFIDSGVGGLSVLREVKKILPREQVIYIADAAFAPYGEKSEEAVCARMVKLTNYLLQQNIKALVIACNTATAAAIDSLRARYAIPIIGVEPAIKSAVAITQTKVVGVLATTGTLASKRFITLTQRHAQQVKLLKTACPDLVRQIEYEPFNCLETESLVRHYVTPMVAQGMDTLVLGCTHFPIVKSLMRTVTGNKVNILDTSLPVAHQLRKRLRNEYLLASDLHKGDLLLTTGDISTLNKFVPYAGLRKFKVQALTDF